MYFIDIDIGQNGGGEGTEGMVNGSVIWGGWIKIVLDIIFTYISLNPGETQKMPVNTIESRLTLNQIEFLQIIVNSNEF